MGQRFSSLCRHIEVHSFTVRTGPQVAQVGGSGQVVLWEEASVDREVHATAGLEASATVSGYCFGWALGSAGRVAG